MLPLMKIAVVGGGNWGTTIAKLIGENVLNKKDFDKNVVLWIYDEPYEDGLLSDFINRRHENPKYLPGISLPDNIAVRTEYDLLDMDILVFCMPHQFLDILKKFTIKSTAIGINLGKGMVTTGNILLTPSEYISNILNIECSCLMGANIATEVAEQRLSDSTLGIVNDKNGKLLREAFQSFYFKTELVPYNKSIEISSALKNIVSIAVGICDGKEWGKNTHAVICRQGLKEMKGVCEALDTTLEVCYSACIGDLLVSCLCGRNYKCGVAMGKVGISVELYEKGMNGQKLQGPSTALTVASWLSRNNYGKQSFPVIFIVNDICQGKSEPDMLLEVLKEYL